MAIVGIDPPDWENANVVQVDSDARENRDAMIEIEDWAEEHGFVRVAEYWLRQIITRDRARRFRGICYRLTEEDMAGINEACQSSAEILAQMPVTPHSVDDDR